ncbi:MAG TPA: phosphatase domain-containing protein [Kofleriaceae bacterium]|nr:phosphatase domain-containing protein [Kofleriaceae bacterium]
MSLLGSVTRSLARRVGLTVGPAPEALPRPAPRHTFRWDLDKTYLRTEFDSLRDLAKTAIETAADKQAYPGAPALLRALRGEDHRICIVSASPSQMRQVLAAKLALDGVEYDEFVLKNNLKNILRGRFRAIRAQIPYKLPALLESRGAFPAAPSETLFGDDAEADAIIYCLYADILAEKVGISDLERILAAARAYPDEAERALARARKVPKADAVRRMFIHLDKRSPPQGFRRYGRRVVPVFNYFQTAVVLYGDGVLSARQVLFVALEMLDSRQFHLGSLANSLQDLMRRGRLEREVALRLATEASEAAKSGALSGRSDLPPFDDIARAFTDRVRQLGGTAYPSPLDDDEPLDYVDLVDEEHEKRRGRRR